MTYPDTSESRTSRWALLSLLSGFTFFSFVTLLTHVTFFPLKVHDGQQHSYTPKIMLWFGIQHGGQLHHETEKTSHLGSIRTSRTSFTL